jgi:nitrite reductase (NADH) large subunit
MAERAEHYLIVGLGAAGVAAAEAIRGLDAQGDILLVSEDVHGYYSRPGLAYYLTGEVPEEMLHPLSEHDFQRLRLRRLQARVTALHLAEHRVEVDQGQSLAYDRLLLATGSIATHPSLPGADLDGVVKLDDMDDARQMLDRSRRARVAVVLGGGITALEIVEGLRALRVRTHYFIRRDRYWSNVLNETESRIVERRLQEEGIQIHYQTEAAEIVGNGGRVTGVRTQDGQLIECGLVAIAVGVRARKELADAAGLKTDRGILVNEYLQTSDPDVFAAGDVAQVFDPFSGKAILDTLWGTAVAQGRAAGQNMVDRANPYHKAVPLNVTRLAGLTTTIIGTVGRGRDRDLPGGIARGDSETWSQLPEAVAVENTSDAHHLRILVSERTLVGAVIMGDQILSLPLHALIAGQVEITPIRDRLLEPGADLEDLIEPFWAEWSKRHATS